MNQNAGFVYYTIRCWYTYCTLYAPSRPNE